jgi:hypothetical protein
MSYLDVPRFNIGGRFYAYPSTVNNDPTHYKVENTNPSPWQTPNGDHNFKFVDCLVKSAMDPNGPLSDDPIIAASINTVEDQNTMNLVSDNGNGTGRPKPKPIVGKLVDIDVYQQGVPTIFGMQFIITLADGGTVKGTMDPATLNQLWWLSVQATRNWAGAQQNGEYGNDSFGGDMNACGIFVSVIRFKEADWPQTSSAFLNNLKANTLQENGEYLLSFRFVVDGYENVPQNENFLFGRMVGSLGPVYENEPMYNPGERWLNGRAIDRAKDPWYYPTFNTCPFKVDETRKKLVIDLANGICRKTPGGPPMDLGKLTAYIQNMDPPQILIGDVDYSAFAFDNNAHIAELALTDQQIASLKIGELILMMSRTDLGDPVVLQEAKDTLNYCVEVRPVRLSGIPGTIGTAKVYINKKGVPIAGKQMKLTVESMHGNTPGVTVPPVNPDGSKNEGNTPQADGAVSAAISASDENGYATISIYVNKDPGYRTPQLDGQLYYIIIEDPDQPPVDWKKISPPQSHYVSCIVFSEYKINENPTWAEIQEIMTPYSKLYPGMKELIDLTDQHSFDVFANNPPWGPVYNAPAGPLGIAAGAIPYFMTRDFNDPMYMPITRDLSHEKLMTVLHYVKNLQAQNSSGHQETT